MEWEGVGKSEEEWSGKVWGRVRKSGVGRCGEE